MVELEFNPGINTTAMLYSFPVPEPSKLLTGLYRFIQYPAEAFPAQNTEWKVGRAWIKNKPVATLKKY